MADIDTLSVKVRNSYGDSFEHDLTDPTCSEVISEFVSIAQQLGYPYGSIYSALLEAGERVKEEIRAASDHIKRCDEQKIIYS